jgi:nanoRNase/pAp phosphatase (c-di-AMP/oligoRNAs hydrolase)
MERVELYLEHAEKAKAQLQLCTTVHHNVAVIDLRREETIYAVNRFMVYALFPLTNISIHVMWGVQKQNTVCAVGKSITNRTSNVNIGALMLVHGGGGHENAGTCQIANERADAVLNELVARINAVG